MLPSNLMLEAYLLVIEHMQDMLLLWNLTPANFLTLSTTPALAFVVRPSARLGSSFHQGAFVLEVSSPSIELVNDPLGKQPPVLKFSSLHRKYLLAFDLSGCRNSCQPFTSAFNFEAHVRRSIHPLP